MKVTGLFILLPDLFFHIVFQVLIAVQPSAQMQYFDVEAKTWKPLASTIPAVKAAECYCALSVGSRLFVAGLASSRSYCIFQYDTERNVWESLHHPGDAINNLCVIDNHMYAINSNQAPQRYSFAKRQWQSIVLVSTRGENYHPGKNGVIIHSKVFVLYENRSQLSFGVFLYPAGLNCFDPIKNKWEVKATTCQPHFGSSLVVVDNRLYVAGGYVSMIFSDNLGRYIPGGNPAPVEMYNEENNTWSVVEQKHIPSNSLGAVEIEGRVYFIINSFPVDSGIRIAPGDLYPVPLGEWENIGNIYQNTVLGYLPVKRESLKTE